MSAAEQPRYVEIVKYETKEVISRLGPMSERKADRVLDGIEINLNHDEFFVRIVLGEK